MSAIFQNIKSGKLGAQLGAMLRKAKQLDKFDAVDAIESRQHTIYVEHMAKKEAYEKAILASGGRVETSLDVARNCVRKLEQLRRA